ncbi:MAG: methyltransferase domain-containing protein [Thermoanaerobaculia bacterium]
MAFWVPPRLTSDELLDGDLSTAEAERSLADLEWVHRYLGGRRLIRRHLVPLLCSLTSPGEALSVLDLGCGSGHVARDLRIAVRERGLALRTFGLDQQLGHARLAARGETLAGDATSLPFADSSVDVIVSTLFVHHFTGPMLQRLFQESARVARRGVVMFDLSRQRLALPFISLVGPLAFQSRVSMADGKASVRQAYTAAEIRAAAQAPLHGSTVSPRGPFTWQLTWLRP